MNVPSCSIAALEPASREDVTQPSALGFTVQSWLALAERQGPVFFVQELQIAVLCGPSVNAEVWRRPDDWSYATSRMGTMFRSQLGENYITASDGDQHRRQRKLLRPVFSGQPLLRHAEKMFENFRQGFAAFATHDTPAELHSALTFIYTQTLNQTLVNTGVDDDMVYRFARFEEEMITGGRLPERERLAWYGRAEYQRLRGQVLGHFEALVEQRLSRATVDLEQADNLDLLIDAWRSRTADDANSSELARDAYLMQAGGAGNTASLLCCTLWALAQRRELLQRVREEIEEAGGALACVSRLSALPFLHSVVREAERCFPPTPALPKVASRDLEIAGFDIAAGTEAMHYFALNNFQADVYTEPFRFDPDRWQRQRLKRAHAFGGGEHMCLGIDVAGLMLNLSLLVILSSYEVIAEAPPSLRSLDEDNDNAPAKVHFQVQLVPLAN